jgi:competence protein ComEC
VDVLVVGHHGSADSAGEALLEKVRPTFAIISVGDDNLYGHPAPELLARLKEYGCIIFCTDENGTIIFRR